MTGTPERRGARIATLVVGGLVAALVLAATTTGTLVALGMAPLDDQRFPLPPGVTALEVHAEDLSVNIVGVYGQSGDRAPSAVVRGVASSTLGPLPGVDIELRGTTAIITTDEPRRTLAFRPNSLDILLGDVALDRIDVVTEGYVSIQGVGAAEVHATSQRGMVHVGVRPGSGLSLLDVTSNAGTQIILPESDGPYQVLLPDWFDDEYVEQWWRDHYGLDYRTEVLGNAPTPPIGADRLGGELVPIRDGVIPEDGPGVFVPTAPDAPVTIDLRSAGGGMLQVVGIDALASLDR